MDDQAKPVIDIEGFCRQSKFLTAIRGPIMALADGPLKFADFNRDVARWQARGETETPFKASLEVVGVEAEFRGPGIEHLGPGRPAVVVANHPFGAVEALVLGRLLEMRGCDIRVMGTQFLANIGPLLPFLIAVDSFDPSQPKSRNLGPLRAAIKALRSGASLLMFPSGIVSHFHLSGMSVRDPVWSDHAVMLARRTSADIVPVFVHGRNSALFNALGLMHPLLRSMLLVREHYRQTATGRVVATVGMPLGADEIARLPDDNSEAAQRLKEHVYSLNPGG